MVKQVNWLRSDDEYTSLIGEHMSVFLMSRLSDDNPRMLGLKILSINTGSNVVNPNFAKLELHYAGPNGHWQRRGSSAWIYEPAAEKPFSEENVEKAAKFYSKFVRMPTLRDRLVVPCGQNAITLMNLINEKVGYELRQIEDLDSITGFQSKTDGLEIDRYTSIDDLMAAPRKTMDVMADKLRRTIYPDQHIPKSF